jgi:hypothetical protein
MEALGVSWEMFCFAGLGALLLWIRLEYGASVNKGIGKFVNQISKEADRQMILSAAVFVLIGAIFSVVMVGPTSIRQALAAGMAWTNILGSAARVSSARSGSKKGPKKED